TNPDVTAWKDQFKKTYGEEPTPDNVNYDYRGAFEANVTPKPNSEDNGMYHWDSVGVDGKDLKSDNHPTRWKSEYMKATGV
ncbi:hypothetical protein, partial [Limosilactobacillus reuteri]|uniref:hypothetical protein n=1 Tax=Limosilactobacillus reuteri TaxID=1598 RepID=UPI00207C5A94